MRGRLGGYTGLIALLDQIRSLDAATALSLVLAEFNADTGTIHKLGDDGLLHLEAHAGGIPAHLLPVIERIPVGKGIAGLAVERQAPVDMCNLQTDSSGDARPGAKSVGVKGSICVPMMKDGRALGVLGVATVREREFTAEETALLLHVGQVLADTL